MSTSDGGLAARTDWLISQSLLGRLRAQGLATDPVFAEAANPEETTLRTERLLAGSHMARMVEELRKVA